jgi:hypothetical protein
LENLEEEFTLRGHSTGTLNLECPRPQISLVGDLCVNAILEELGNLKSQNVTWDEEKRVYGRKLAGTLNLECPP